MSTSLIRAVREARVADAEFDAFYRANFERVLKYTYRRLADLETAKEVTADCFVAAWKKFDPTEPFQLPWLYATARNLIGNAYQKRDRDRRLMQALERQISIAGEVADLSDVTAALSVLADLDREALLLTYWERLSAVEVAAALGCSEQAAWKRISRARIAMRTALATLERPGV